MDTPYSFQIDPALPVALTVLGRWKWLLMMTMFPLLVFFFFQTGRTSPIARVTPGGPFGKIDPARRKKKHGCILNQPGIFTLQTIIKHLRQNHFYEWMTACLDRPGHTAEMTIFGTRYILTEEPENIKAIFTSQVDLVILFSTRSANLRTVQSIWQSRHWPEIPWSFRSGHHFYG